MSEWTPPPPGASGSRPSACSSTSRRPLIFVTAIFLFDEPMSPARLASFALIWLGLAIYSVSAVREDRRQRERARLPG